jgi:hypothetical protein
MSVSQEPQAELTDAELLSSDPETLTAEQLQRLEKIVGDPEYAS